MAGAGSGSVTEPPNHGGRLWAWLAVVASSLLLLQVSSVVIADALGGADVLVPTLALAGGTACVAVGFLRRRGEWLVAGPTVAAMLVLASLTEPARASVAEPLRWVGWASTILASMITGALVSTRREATVRERRSVEEQGPQHGFARVYALLAGALLVVPAGALVHASPAGHVGVSSAPLLAHGVLWMVWAVALYGAFVSPTLRRRVDEAEASVHAQAWRVPEARRREAMRLVALGAALLVCVGAWYGWHLMTAPVAPPATPQVP